MPGLVHGFFGRAGGVSRGPFASLNLGDTVGDDPIAVEQNWKRVGAVTGGMRVVRPRQVHGREIVHVSATDRIVGEADGVAVRDSGILLAVLTADCVPILLVAPEAHLAMAVHAGWRGTLAGIAAAAVALGRERWGVAAQSLRVAIGPAICGTCYEVDAGLGEQMQARWRPPAGTWRRQGAYGRLDLRAVNRHILRQSGVPEAGIVDVGPCTSCGEGLFSHRRDAGRSGRQASVIGWTE